MSGLNFGRGYWLTSAIKKVPHRTEGVHFNDLSGKWCVVVPNTTQSKYPKPFLMLAQYPTREEAEQRYQAYLQGK